jgi:exopolysaccharide biosynthesis predicted pyruvyltransferase EpsI
MLVDVSFYTAIMNEKNTCRKVYPATHSKKILCYVLDDSRVTENIIESTVNDLGAEYEVFRIFDKGNDFQKHTIGEWLKLFYEADVIITDSFHGTIFSILFNKQFLVLCNKDRGAARFHSLLGILQLNDRMVEPDMDGSVKEADIHEQIDYQLVNKKVEEWKEYSKQFLLESLK